MTMHPMIQRSGFFYPLPTGRMIFLRPVMPADRERMSAALAYMSAESIYTRFLRPVKSVTAAQLDYLTRVDQRAHVAWGVLDPFNWRFPGIAIGRYVQVADKPGTAELAITVVDAFQRSGVGTILTALLYRLAQQNGVQTMSGVLSGRNSFMAARGLSIGGHLVSDFNAYEFELPVMPQPTWSGTPFADRLRQTWSEIGRYL